MVQHAYYVTTEHTRFIMEARAWCKPQLLILKTHDISALNRLLGTLILWKNTHVTVGSLGSHGRTHRTPWLSHLLLEDEQMGPVHYTPGKRTGSLPTGRKCFQIYFMKPSCIKERIFFFSRCVRRDFSRLWGRCFVSCNMRKTVALCPGMDNVTKRTLWGEVWCERSASPKLSPGLVA